MANDKFFVHATVTGKDIDADVETRAMKLAPDSLKSCMGRTIELL